MASCAAPSPILTLMVSRTLPFTCPRASVTWPTKSNSVVSPSPRRDKRDFAARDFDRDRHKVMVAHQPEVVDLQGQRQVRHRVAEEQRLLQLPLLIGGGRFVEFLGRKISIAVIKLRLVLLGNVDLHAAEFAVGRGVAVVVAEHVIAAQVFPRLLYAQGKIVGIQQCLASGIFGEREKRLLLVVEFLLLRSDGLRR